MTLQTPTTYEPCDTCAAPLDADQRFCVVCGTNRRHPADPVSQYLSAARRPAPAAVAPVAPRRSDGWPILAALALVPIAAAAGVLVGRSGSDKADPNLVAALRAQQAALAKSAAAGPATAVVADTGAGGGGQIASDFDLSKGFVVELKTLPKTADQDAVDAAQAAAKKDGAKDLGILAPGDFTLKPAAAGGAYVLYSGEFKTKGEATKALGKLKKPFPKAVVVAVATPKGGKGASAAPDGESLKGTVDEDTKIQAHPTQQQKDEGAQVVQEIQSKVGKDYVEQQQQLPDTIVVP
ncbi:MAG: hypothetical protein QOF76_971 [Solirubrobacteraceae bacterium]|nr:hypothetical protein [Solirubrobacteraceae bacterium]